MDTVWGRGRLPFCLPTWHPFLPCLQRALWPSVAISIFWDAHFPSIFLGDIPSIPQTLLEHFFKAFKTALKCPPPQISLILASHISEKMSAFYGFCAWKDRCCWGLWASVKYSYITKSPRPNLRQKITTFLCRRNISFQPSKLCIQIIFEIGRPVWHI